MENNYTLIEQKFVRFEQGLPTYLMTIQVDTEEDIPQPRESWSAGSMCMVAEDHTYKLLNSEGAWV